MFFAKIPRHASQNAITEGLNAFWLATVKVLNSYVFCKNLYEGER